MQTIAMLSLDEVHRSQVTCWADRQGKRVVSWNPHELTHDTAADMVVCDWDYWSERDRQRIVAWLSALPARTEVVVKGYFFRPDQAKLLASFGAVVQSAWDPGWFEAPVAHGAKTQDRGILASVPSV